MNENARRIKRCNFNVNVPGEESGIVKVSMTVDDKAKEAILIIDGHEDAIANLVKSEGINGRDDYTRLLHGRCERIEGTASIIVNCGASPPQFRITTRNANGSVSKDVVYTITHEVQDHIVHFIDSLAVDSSSRGSSTREAGLVTQARTSGSRVRS